MQTYIQTTLCANSTNECTQNTNNNNQQEYYLIPSTTASMSNSDNNIDHSASRNQVITPKGNITPTFAPSLHQIKECQPTYEADHNIPNVPVISIDENKCITNSRDDQLSVMYYNAGGFTEHKQKAITEIARSLRLDIVVILDTRLIETGTYQCKKNINHVLGSKYRTHFLSTVTQ